MISPGTSLGPYEVIALIGAGGMGQVYKARDSRLDRIVAVKVASEGFTERFEREARAVAAFNHPHICQLYDVGPNYLVMELVDGEPVKGPLPVDKAVAYANQILDALAAAHQKGIIHRDLKPANILVTKQGIKLLDFGLAKQEGPVHTSGDETVTNALTGRNQIVGTLPYMAPEQLQNAGGDARSDLFAFGCVLYEMLSGKRAFGGDSAAAVIGAILHREPEPLDVAPLLNRIIRRCLAKDPDSRFQTARDLQYNLGLAMESHSPEAAKTVERSRLPWIAAAVSAAVAVVAMAALWAPWRNATGAPALIRVSDELPPGFELPHPPFGGRVLALSPDGTRLAASVRGPDHKVQIQTRLLKESTWTTLDGSDGGLFPFFSPDGAWIGFVAENKIRKLPLTGGTPEDVVQQSNNGFRGASWGSDGYIYYGSIGEGLRRIAASDGTIQQLGRQGRSRPAGYWPQLLPGAKALLYTEPAFNIDASNINAMMLDTGEVRTVQHGGFSALYLQDPNRRGRLVFMHETSIFTVPFNLSRLAIEGTPEALVDGVASGNYRGGDFAASDTSLLTYIAGKAERPIPTTISWIDRAGKVSPLYGVAASYNNPRLSPDGKRIVYAVATATGSDLWVKDLDRDTPTRLTFVPGRSDWPAWSPDSRSIVFSGMEGTLYWVDVDGSGAPEILAQGLWVVQGLAAFSSDGKRLVFSHSRTPRGGYFELATGVIEGEKGHRKLGAVEPLLDVHYDQRHPALSPDGKWIAYDSLESGTGEVYVRPFPGLGGKWRVSSGGGLHPVGFRNGRELLYHNPTTGRAMVVSYAVNNGEFRPGSPEPWSNTPLQGNPVYRSYDLAPDGKRLAVVGLSDQVLPSKPPTSIGFLIKMRGSD